MEYELGHCRPDELPNLVELADRVFRANRAGSMGSQYPLVFDAANAENLRVARAGTQMVAHVGLCIRDAHILGARLRVASVGAVATDPEHRGNGLASRLMADARQHSRERGASLMLISGGRGLYHRLGYVQVGAYRSYTITAGAVRQGLQLDLFHPGDLPELVALYQAEAVRFFRPAADWNRMLAAGMLMNQPAELLTIRSGGTLLAYAGVQRPAPGKSAEGAPVCIREFAGSRSALAAALPGIASQYGAAAVEIVAGAGDAGWQTQAHWHRWEATSTAFPGTLGIIDAAEFCRSIRPLLAERVGTRLSLEADGEGAVLSVEGESIRLATQGELTAMAFGGETAEARAVPPLPPHVEAVVRQAFPLPLPWYGFNYV